MAKTKTPFFGLGSRGTVADTLTSQRRSRQTLVRVKPVPTDPRTDPQIWHRHIYRVGCQLWNGLSNAQKQTYNSAGTHYHRTGLAQFLHVKLPLLHQLAAYWPLDILDAAITDDYSGNRNHSTIFGASPIAGVFNDALRFDGLNDFTQALDSPTLDLTTQFSIALWARDYFSIQKSLNLDRTFLFWKFNTDNLIRIHISNSNPAAWDATRISSIAIPDANWHFYMATFIAGQLHIFIDGILRDGALLGAIPPVMRTNNAALELGRRIGAIVYYEQSDIDEPMLWPLYLTQEDVTLLFNRTEAS